MYFLPSQVVLIELCENPALQWQNPVGTVHSPLLLHRYFGTVTKQLKQKR